MKIVPKEIDVEPKIGDSIRITPIIADLYAETCSLHYSIHCVDGNNLKTGRIDLTPEEYSGWGFDNSYLEDLVLEKLGLERLEEE
jgi:hypothetical protein